MTDIETLFRWPKNPSTSFIPDKCLRKKGSLFEVIISTSTTYNTGDIVKLSHDDGTTIPLFEIAPTIEHYISWFKLKPYKDINGQ